MKRKRTRRRIERTMPPVGTKLRGKFFNNVYHAEICKDRTYPEGRVIKFRGKLYSSMTSAAQAITEQPTNGWRFWKIVRD